MGKLTKEDGIITKWITRQVLKNVRLRFVRYITPSTSIRFDIPLMDEYDLERVIREIKNITDSIPINDIDITNCEMNYPLAKYPDFGIQVSRNKNITRNRSIGISKYECRHIIDILEDIRGELRVSYPSLRKTIHSLVSTIRNTTIFAVLLGVAYFGPIGNRFLTSGRTSYTTSMFICIFLLNIIIGTWCAQEYKNNLIQDGWNIVREIQTRF